MRFLLTIFQALNMRRRVTILSAGITYLSQVIAALQGFVLIPLYIHRLGLDAYGYWLGLLGLLSLITVADLGLNQVIQTRTAAAAGAGRHADVSGYFWVGAVSITTLALILVAFLVPLSRWMVRHIGAPESLWDKLAMAFAVAACALALRLVNDFLRGAATSIMKPGPLLTAMVFGQMLGLGVTVTLLLLNAGVLAPAIGLASTEVFMLLASITFFGHEHLHHRLLRSPPDRAHFRDAFSLAPYTLLSQAGNRLARQADVSVITLLLGPAPAVIYTANRKISDFLGRLVSILWGSLILPIAHLAGEKTQAQSSILLKRILMNLSGVVILFASIYVAMNATIVQAWLGVQIASPLLLVFFLGLSRIGDNVFSMYSEAHLALGNIRFYTIGTIIMACLALLLYFPLIRIIGLEGVPLAFALSAFACTMLFMREDAARILSLALHGVPALSKQEAMMLAGSIVAALSLGAISAATAQMLPAPLRWAIGVATGALLLAGWFRLFYRSLIEVIDIPACFSRRTQDS